MPKRMRPVSRDEGFQALRRLRCFNEVFERLKAGWAPSELARFIQDDRSEYTHATRPALMQIIQRFRDTIPPAQLFNTRIPDKFIEAKKEVEEGIDELKEMEKLYRLQMERISIDCKNEQNIKKLMPTMTQEIRVARELLAGIADLKMDLGLTTRAGEKVDVNVNVTTDVGRYGKKSVETVMADPERRRKVLNVAERMLAFPGRLEVIDVSATEVSEPVEPAEAAQDGLVDENSELEELNRLEAEIEEASDEWISEDAIVEEREKVRS